MEVSRIMLAASVLTILIVGNGRSQTLRQIASSNKPPGADRFITVGDYRFHYRDQGAGGPVVVMDAGLCQTMETWGSAPAAVAAFTRVFVYERAGLGRSSRILPPGADQSSQPPEARTSRKMAQELRDLLRKAGLPAPYVLVGHSLGGLNVRLFASEYPNEVAGLVLIDGSNEEEYFRFAALLPPDRAVNYLGLNQGANCERINLDASADQLRQAPPLPHVPFTVITAASEEKDLKLAQTHLELQADLARRAPNSTHIFAERSGHFIQLDRPDIVIEAIRNVVKRARPEPIPLPTEDDLKQTRVLRVFMSTEAALSGMALALLGLTGWRLRKRKRDGHVELNRAQRRQELRKEKDRKKGQGK